MRGWSPSHHFSGSMYTHGQHVFSTFRTSLKDSRTRQVPYNCRPYQVCKFGAFGVCVSKYTKYHTCYNKVFDPAPHTHTISKTYQLSKHIIKKTIITNILYIIIKFFFIGPHFKIRYEYKGVF